MTTALKLIVIGAITFALLKVSTPYAFQFFGFTLTNLMAIGGALILSVLFTYALKEN